MTKQTKILIGLGVVGVAGYLYWKSQPKKANLTSAKTGPGRTCPCKSRVEEGNYMICDNVASGINGRCPKLVNSGTTLGD